MRDPERAPVQRTAPVPCRRGLGRAPAIAAWIPVLVALAACTSFAGAGDLPDGYMSEERSQAMLDKTLRVHLDPDISSLSAGERQVVDLLIEVGEVFERLHLQMRHHQALSGYEDLVALDRSLGSPRATQNLMTLYYAGKGPIVRDLDGKRKTILPVDGFTPGRNVYPWGVTREEIDAFLERHPEERGRILDVRTIVRRASSEAARRDLSSLDRHPVLDALHPSLRARLDAVAARPDESGFYAVPYAVAFADDMVRCFGLLMRAAGVIEAEDGEFAGYLRNRARDFLSNDYESGDASWVRGHFQNLNAEIGAYEVYDDALYGVKAFFALNVLVRDQARSEQLRRAIKGIQAYENALPYEPEGWTGGNKKTVRDDIPVGVYNVVADFGQSRGGNTATILPNESEFARKYGRTILLRNNIMTNPTLFSLRQEAFDVAVAPDHAGGLTPEGGFYRTLWHEIGHYLGVDRTRDGRELDDALEPSSSAYEELKADLVSLYLAKYLAADGYFTAGARRAVYADGVRRVLLKRRPQRSQPYATMQLMQFNFYLEAGLFEFDPKRACLVIHYDRFHDVVTRMLEKVLAIMYEGDAEEVESFIVRYTNWEDDPHEALAAAMRSAETYRYRYLTYEVLHPGGE